MADLCEGGSEPPGSLKAINCPMIVLNLISDTNKVSLMRQLSQKIIGDDHCNQDEDYTRTSDCFDDIFALTTLLTKAARCWIEANFQKRECVKFIPSPKDEHRCSANAKSPLYRYKTFSLPSFCRYFVFCSIRFLFSIVQRSARIFRQQTG
ncbi:hypothetical protein ANN_23180 [Periplaneta americana]|uniref:Uncharacterized protein n=1 Tax=Periplaneta americana TaxID=6978 RepID=A0ABQ8SKV5_PERAM|nr:hypothetical protein ANN_23180 [Periplaneta americana]